MFFWFCVRFFVSFPIHNENILYSKIKFSLKQNNCTYKTCRSDDDDDDEN